MHADISSGVDEMLVRAEVDRIKDAHKDKKRKLAAKAEVDRIKAAHADDKGNCKMTREAAVKIINLLAPGRIVVDSETPMRMWVCDPKKNTWSCEDEDRFNRLLRYFEDDLGDWADRGKALAVYIKSVRSFEDGDFPKKVDKTLGPGMFPFQDGQLLDLSTPQPSIRQLQPDDFVSITGTIKRDLGSDHAAVLAQCSMPGSLDELEAELPNQVGDGCFPR